MKEKSLDDYIYISLTITCIILALLGLIYHHFFNEVPISSCLIYENLGFYCPGCGCTRAFEALLDFNILKSVYYNPVVLYAVIILFLYLSTQTIDRSFHHKKFIMTYSNSYLYIGIAILLLNCFFRNLLFIVLNIKL